MILGDDDECPVADQADVTSRPDQVVLHLELLPAPVAQTPHLCPRLIGCLFMRSDGLSSIIVALSHGTARPFLMKSNTNILTGLSPF
jgi:hypothetical protein